MDFPLELTEDITLYAVRQTDFDNYLPIIRVDTNGVKPSKTDEYTPASITLENTEERFAFEDLSAGIRRRGNSTANFAKKPYRIKFDQEISMFGEKKHKSWVLLAMYLDASLIRDYLGHHLAQRFDNLEFASCAYHVELYLNGAYQGVYLLCDQIQEQKDSRIPVEIDADELKGRTDVPFIIEKNQVRAEGESQYPYDWFAGATNTQYTIKYPENPTRLQYEYIKDYFLTVEQAVIDNDYNTVVEMLDVESAYDWFLVNELMYNWDSVQLSAYFYKTLDGKMKLGPAWDFDNSFTPTYTGLIATVRNLELASRELYTRKNFRSTFMEHMFKNEIFRAEYCTRWKEMRYEVLDVLDHIRKYRVALRPAARRNNELWYQNVTLDDGSGTPYVPDEESLFEDQYTFIDQFLMKRITFFRLLHSLFRLISLRFLLQNKQYLGVLL